MSSTTAVNVFGGLVLIYLSGLILLALFSGFMGNFGIPVGSFLVGLFEKLTGRYL